MRGETEQNQLIGRTNSLRIYHLQQCRCIVPNYSFKSSFISQDKKVALVRTEQYPKKRNLRHPDDEDQCRQYTNHYDPVQFGISLRTVRSISVLECVKPPSFPQTVSICNARMTRYRPRIKMVSDQMDACVCVIVWLVDVRLLCSCLARSCWCCMLCICDMIRRINSRYASRSKTRELCVWMAKWKVSPSIKLYTECHNWRIRRIARLTLFLCACVRVWFACNESKGCVFRHENSKKNLFYHAQWAISLRLNDLFQCSLLPMIWIVFLKVIGWHR